MKKAAVEYSLFRSCFILFISLILISMPCFVNSTKALTATVGVYPPSITVGVGQIFSINITVSGVANLYGWEFRLSWNPTLLDAANAVEGPFLKTGGSTFFSYNTNSAMGHMIVDCTLLGMVPGVSGSGTLAIITFYAKSAGECPLDLYNVTLLNSFEQPIPCQVVDGYGYFTSSEQHDVAVISVIASPTITTAGNIVSISISVQNQGGFAETFNITIYANAQVVGIQLISMSSGPSTTIPFTWDTTGFGKGEYAISASASTVLGEVDIADNNKTAGDKVAILSNGHDVAVISVIPSQTIIGQGYCTSINVTVKDYGPYGENFNIAVQANLSNIQTKAIALCSGASFSLIFTWNTSNWAKGHYAMRVVADTVPGEIEIYDNTLTDGMVYVGVPGDVDSNHVVNMLDLYNVALHFGASFGNPNYAANCDIDDNGIINMLDLYISATHYG